MKRSPELTPLSHDHHQALFCAHRLKRAETAQEAEDAVAGFLAYWEDHGSPHFRTEEEILLPGWIEAAPAADRKMASRVLGEHLAIRAQVRRLRRERLAIEELQELGELVERHVRFEERELFPRIEDELEDEALARLGAEIESTEPGATEHGGAEERPG